MVQARVWTGFEAVALQTAMRLSVRDFAGQLGLDQGTVSRWRSGLGAITLRTRSQQILDIALQQRASPEDRERFEKLINAGQEAWIAHNRPAVERRRTSTDRPDESEATAQIEPPTRVAAIAMADGNDPPRPSGLKVAQFERSSRGSIAFAEWALGIESGKLSLQWIADELSSVTNSFVHASPAPLLARLAQIRGRIATALSERPTRELQRDLLVLAGITIELMAQVSENTGDPLSALEHVAAAEALARECGHNGLLAWTWGTKALIREWHGDPVTAISIAERALQIAPAGDSTIRLSALIARCAARIGNSARARDAAATAITALEARPTGIDELTALGGSLTFPEAKMTYYLGTTYRLLGNHSQCEAWSARAIEAYATGPAERRSYGDETLARADIAISRLSGGSVDGALDILQPVLALPVEQRIAPISAGLITVETAAIASAEGADLASEIRTFLGQEILL